MPSKLAFPPHLVPQAWFTWSLLGTQVLQCSCHVSSCSSLLLGLRELQNHIFPLALDLLPQVAPLFLVVMLGGVTAPVDASHHSVLRRSSGIPSTLLIAPRGTCIWCLWTWRVPEVPAKAPHIAPWEPFSAHPCSMALPHLLVLFSLLFFSCSCFPRSCSSCPT